MWFVQEHYYLRAFERAKDGQVSLSSTNLDQEFFQPNREVGQQKWLSMRLKTKRLSWKKNWLFEKTYVHLKVYNFTHIMYTWFIGVSRCMLVYVLIFFLSTNVLTGAKEAYKKSVVIIRLVRRKWQKKLSLHERNCISLICILEWTSHYPINYLVLSGFLIPLCLRKENCLYMPK